MGLFTQYCITMTDIEFDWNRQRRTGIAEAVLCSGKSSAQVHTILEAANERKVSLLLTRLDSRDSEMYRSDFDNLRIHSESATAILDNGLPDPVHSDCLIVTAGSSDSRVAAEAQQTLHYYGLTVPVVGDCGVAGLWRLTDKIERLSKAPVIIAVAGMEGALFSVLAGMVPGLVIAVPSSNGYGVAEGGKAALSSALASCAPGVVSVNIDNGFGAACALLKMQRAILDATL